MLAIVSILGGIRIQIRYFIKRIQNTSAYTYQYLYCKCPSDKKKSGFRWSVPNVLNEPYRGRQSPYNQI